MQKKKKREKTQCGSNHLTLKKSWFAYVVAYFQGNTYVAIIKMCANLNRLQTHLPEFPVWLLQGSQS